MDAPVIRRLNSYMKVSACCCSPFVSLRFMQKLIYLFSQKRIETFHTEKIAATVDSCSEFVLLDWKIFQSHRESKARWATYGSFRLACELCASTACKIDYLSAREKSCRAGCAPGAAPRPTSFHTWATLRESSSGGAWFTLNQPLQTPLVLWTLQSFLLPPSLRREIDREASTTRHVIG